MTQAVITQLNNQRFLLLYEENELVECHPLQEEQSLKIGNIYIGRVEKVVKNIQSAFIRLDADNIGYLPLNDKPAIVLNRQLPKGLPSIAEGDKVLVQVEQEPQKMKQARVTGNISLGGNYVVLDLSSGHVGVSKKIQDAERSAELRELVVAEQILQQESTYHLEQKQPNDDFEKRKIALVKDGIEINHTQVYDMRYGCVLRTACENASNKDILSEYRQLCDEMNKIFCKAQYERNTGLIRSGKSEWISILRDYGMERLNEIKTNLLDVYKEWRSEESTISKINYSSTCDEVAVSDNMYIEITFYDDKDYPLCKLLSLETELKKLLSKKVWLKSGGFLIIESTEAMVVIDVNSGKSIGKNNKDNHILKVNLEAAEEIVKQLRLRNLSGIIMVDFINMNRNEDKQQVVKCLERGLKKDKIPGCFVEITKLDVFELTRKKVRRPLHEVVKMDK